MTAVIYARYSSDNQREESIEGQIREWPQRHPDRLCRWRAAQGVVTASRGVSPALVPRLLVLNFLPVRLKIHNQAVEFQEDGNRLPSLVLIDGLAGLRTYQKMLN